MKSRLFTRTGIFVLLTSLICVYFLGLRFNIGIRKIPMLNRMIYEDVVPKNITKKILFWNTMFGDENFYFKKENVFENCRVSDCYAAPRKGFEDPVEFDAILFHGNELNRQDLPEGRRPEQWYVYVNLESPANRPLMDSFYADYFNLTITYRLDSDVRWTYGAVREIRTGEIVAPLPNTTWNDVPEFASDRAATEDYGENGRVEEHTVLTRQIKSKSKPIVWFVSNCGAASGRSVYVKELSRHLEVDTYGSCGDYQCRRNRDCFREIVEPTYFFYLSFENSLCQDYVTEKLFNPLRYNVVPVVYGGANYSKFVPPNSYVNALDFETPRHLATYLKRLMSNTEEYQRYFQWKKRYRVDQDYERTICDLCEFLHRKQPARTPQTFLEWYNLDACPIQRLLTNGGYATRRTLEGLEPHEKHVSRTADSSRN